jgi:hypothetical protein
VIDSTRAAVARPRRRSLSAALIVVVIATAVACGKKGPPLAPFSRVPSVVTAVTPLRIGDDVYVSFKVPDTNADGQKPAAIDEVEVYAVTSAQPPATENQRKVATLIATLPVRPVLPVPPPPVNGSPPPVIQLPPGVDPGAAVAARETLTPEARVPVELPVDRLIARADESHDTEVPFGPLVAPAPAALPRRHYFVVAKSPRGRESVPSTPVSIPLEAGSSAPGAPVVTNTASELTVSWTPPPDARTSTFLLPPSVKPTVAANATPSNTTPRVPPLLTAKSLSFNSQATTYHLYDVTPSPTAAEPDPYAIQPPLPITPAPVPATEFVIKGVSFGAERCFEVRPVDSVFGVTVIGPASPRTCFTPKDTFGPVAPKSLAAIAGAGVINLIWDANPEGDLAGYIVLRGDAPGDTLQPLTKEPVTVTSYRDESVRPGTRYVYAIVAVDRAGNSSPQSNRAEETARQ